jgi:hypothetical protein
MFKILGNAFRRYSYAMTDMSSAKMELWRALQDANVFHPIIDSVADFRDQDAVAQAVLRVTSHHAKGKVLLHIGDEC